MDIPKVDDHGIGILVGRILYPSPVKFCLRTLVDCRGCGCQTCVLDTRETCMEWLGLTEVDIREYKARVDKEKETC